MTNSKSAAYAPRWISYAQQILAGLNDGTRSTESDKTTYRVIVRIVQTLAKGNALSDKQRMAFVESIRVRLGRLDFAWDGTVKLTRSQLVPARELAARFGLKVAPSRIDAGMESVTREEYNALLARVAHLEGMVGQILSHSCEHPVSIQPDSCSNPAEMTPEFMGTLAFPDLTTRNETKRNHDGDMSCPSGDPMIPGPAAANDLPFTQDMRDNGDERKTRAAQDRVVVSYFRNDPARAPSANLEYAGQRFSLVFHSADVADDKLAAVCSKDWREALDREGGADLREQSRRYPNSDFRYVLSPLYEEKDRFGFKDPAVSEAAAALIWDEDGSPHSVIVIAGSDFTTVPLTGTDPLKRKPKGPTYKGSVKLAA